MNERATGDYIVHLDDDDWVSDTYIPDILNAIADGPDCVGSYELVQGLAPHPQIAIWTHRAQRWETDRTARRYGATYIRTPGHKTPIRADIARAIHYADMGFGEDEDYSKRLKASGLIKTEAFIHKVMQHYRYIHKGRDQYA